MADTVTTRVLTNTAIRRAVFVTIESDGTNGATTLADLSALDGSAAKLVVRKVQWNQHAAANSTMVLDFDHTTDDLAIAWCGEQDRGCFEFCGNGIIDPASAGGTGDLVFTVAGLASGDKVNLLVECDIIQA